MGCDIHVFAEKKNKNGHWEALIPDGIIKEKDSDNYEYLENNYPFSEHRNYWVFGVLTNGTVRCDIEIDSIYHVEVAKEKAVRKPFFTTHDPETYNILTVENLDEALCEISRKYLDSWGPDLHSNHVMSEQAIKELKQIAKAKLKELKDPKFKMLSTVRNDDTNHSNFSTALHENIIVWMTNWIEVIQKHKDFPEQKVRVIYAFDN